VDPRGRVRDLRPGTVLTTRLRLGAKLPAILVRYVPFASNARMPGRAIVGVYMALAVLIAISIGAGRSAAIAGAAVAARRPGRSSTDAPIA
jgi:hypothetical protein